MANAKQGVTVACRGKLCPSCKRIAKRKARILSKIEAHSTGHTEQ